MKAWTTAFCILFAATAVADFALNDENGKLTITENGKPVLVYNYAVVAPPDARIPKNFGRECYIHPLFGPEGDVMTQDFPSDHYHHRGVFWAWPECKVGDRHLDVWALLDARPHHEEWVTREAGADKAVVAVKDFWAFDDAPDKAIVKEEVAFTVLPADDKGRAIDFDLKFTNVSDQVVSFLGAKGKGYGGFCFRPDAARRPLTFTSIEGRRKANEDALSLPTPWADVTLSPDAKGVVSGAAIFQDPKNPGYPHPGWIFRHYGFLGVSWPHEQTHVLNPGESFELRYRLYVHRGNAEEAKVADRFVEYTAAAK